MNESILRAIFGLLWAAPAMWFSERLGLDWHWATLAVTVWMTGGWRVYNLASRWLQWPF